MNIRERMASARQKLLVPQIVVACGHQSLVIGLFQLVDKLGFPDSEVGGEGFAAVVLHRVPGEGQGEGGGFAAILVIVHRQGQLRGVQTVVLEGLLRDVVGHIFAKF